jgi:hypothetical protein
MKQVLIWRRAEDAAVKDCDDLPFPGSGLNEWL